LTRPPALEYTFNKEERFLGISQKREGHPKLSEVREMKMEHVSGKNKGQVILYGLSTCVWCKKTKQLLDQMGVEYDFVEVDLLPGDEKNRATDEVKKLNPRCSFPTLAVNQQCIVGYEEQKIKEALGS
jgi:glutaredoxin-like protein NrdH